MRFRLYRSHTPPSPDGAGHDHDLPGSLLAMLTVVIVGLAAAIVIVAVAADRRVSALEEYVAGRGVQRDAENQRLNDRLDRSLCNLLDRLPAYPDLESARAEYGCGPGLPLPEEFP